MNKRNWYTDIGVKLFLMVFITLTILQMILGLITSNFEIYWSIILIPALFTGLFGWRQYEKIVIEVPIEDKEQFSIFLREYIECAGMKIVSENKDIVILKPKFGWIVYRWIVKEKTEIVLQENRAVLSGPSLYIEKIKLIVETN